MKWNSREEERVRLYSGQCGSAMLWSLMALTLLLVFSVTFMTMGAVALTKAKKEAAYSQAYYTSKGVVDLAADMLLGENAAEAAHRMLLYVDEAAGRNEDYESCGEDPEKWDPVEGLPDGMGECCMRIYYRAETDGLYISARTSKGGCQRIVTLELERENPDLSEQGGQPGENPAEGAEGSGDSVWIPMHYTEADKIGKNTRR